MALIELYPRDGVPCCSLISPADLKQKIIELFIKLYQPPSPKNRMKYLILFLRFLSGNIYIQREYEVSSFILS